MWWTPVTLFVGAEYDVNVDFYQDLGQDVATLSVC